MKQQGFSLVELMVALAIFSVVGLGMMNMPSFITAEDGKDYNDPYRSVIAERKAIEVTENILDQYAQVQAGFRTDITDESHHGIIAVAEAGYDVGEFNITIASGTVTVVATPIRGDAATCTATIGTVTVTCD